MKSPIFSLAAGWLPLVFSLFSTPFFAQNQLAGSVQDAVHQPLPFANVLLLAAADSSLVVGNFTKDDGSFVFENVPAGSFVVGFSMLGFEPMFSKTIVFNEKTGRINLETVSLKENAALLDEVMVVAKRPFLEQKIDRTVVNVANSITSAGGTALQVLQRSPGVQVNMSDKSISLSGKEGVVVMINGKIERLPADAVVQMLEGMNADNIDRIELIHTPPANFEAEGNAGIINIVLKTSADAGLNGGYSAKIGYGKGEKYGAGGYFNFRKKRVNFFGSYDLNENNNPQKWTSYRRMMEGSDVLETDVKSDRFHTPLTMQNARLGLDFQISKKTVVGVLGTFLDRNWYMEAESDAIYLKNGLAENRLRMPNSETNHNRSFAGNVNLSHQFSAKQSLNLDADFVKYDIDNPSDYEVIYLDAAGETESEYGLHISKKTPIQVAVAKADYTLNFGKNGRMESGAKFTMLGFDNDLQVDSLPVDGLPTTISDLTSKAHLAEKIAGAYTTFSFKMDEKTDVKAGIRYEFTTTNLGSVEQPNLVDRKYGGWFPSLFVTRKMSETQSLNASYSRRTTRPSMRNLAPGTIFIDPTTTMAGNPGLKPAFTDALKLEYGLKAWRLSVSFSEVKNPIRWVPNVDMTTGKQQNRAENLDRERVGSANLFVPMHPTGWWDMQNNVFVNRREIDFDLDGQPFQIGAIEWGFNSTQTIRLPRRFVLEISGEYNSPSVWGVAKWVATGIVSTGIQKDFGSRGKLNFNVNNLFLGGDDFGTTERPEIDLLVKSSWQFSERVFMLSWSNTFGNKKLKSSRQRQTGSAEEMQRI